MARTAMRPIPSGRVSRSEALVFGLILGICAILALGTLLNMAAAALLAFTIFFYVVYTMCSNAEHRKISSLAVRLAHSQKSVAPTRW